MLVLRVAKAKTAPEDLLVFDFRVNAGGIHFFRNLYAVSEKTDLQILPFYKLLPTLLQFSMQRLSIVAYDETLAASTKAGCCYGGLGKGSGRVGDDVAREFGNSNHVRVSVQIWQT